MAQQKKTDTEITEKAFLQAGQEMYGIYQMKEKHLRSYGFLGYEQILKKMSRRNVPDFEIDPSLYSFTFAEGSTFIKEGIPMRDALILEELFQMFNSDIKPLGFKGRSISVGDVIVLRRKSTVGFTNKAYYVDRFGFKELSRWTENLDGIGLKTIIPSHTVNLTKFVLRFYEKNVDGNYSLDFPCDKDGNMLMQDIVTWADEYLEACNSGKYEKPKVCEVGHPYLEPGYYMCPCGERFVGLPDADKQLHCPSCRRAFNAEDGKELPAETDASKETTPKAKKPDGTA